MKYIRWLKKNGYRCFFSDIPTNEMGSIYWEDKLILIDPAKNLVDTFLHEYVHARYPKLSESKTEDMAFKMRCKMSTKEIKKLAVYILDNFRKVKVEEK